MKSDGHLAIGDLTQGSTVLPCYSDGMLAGFRERGFVNNPNFGIRKKIDHLQGKAPLDFLNSPWALSNKLTQSLNVGAGDSVCNRLNGFAVPVQQQSFKINSGPVSPLTPAHWFKKVSEELAQPKIQCY
jgi:hypothetical protein